MRVFLTCRNVGMPHLQLTGDRQTQLTERHGREIGRVTRGRWNHYFSKGSPTFHLSVNPPKMEMLVPKVDILPTNYLHDMEKHVSIAETP